MFQLQSEFNTIYVDLKFGSPLFRFTFEEYLKYFLNYDPWEYEHLDWLYKEYESILQS